MPTPSPRYALNLLSEGQSSGEVTANEFLLFLEAVKDGKVLSRTLTTPPGSPVNGNLHIVPTGATGVWASQVGKYSWYWNGYRFITPQDGDIVRIVDEKVTIQYSALETSWFPLHRIWSTSEYWTGEYGEGGTKVFCKCFEVAGPLVGGLNAITHSISPLALAKHPRIEVAYYSSGLGWSFQDGVYADLGLSAMGSYVDPAQIVLDVMGPVVIGGSARIRFYYQKT